MHNAFITAENAHEVESVIGYAFSDVSLLICALTNSSYVNEHGGESNERLEFLGDAILDFLVAEHLYETHDDDEGALTRLRAEIVSRTPLARAVDDMGLLPYYRLGNGMLATLENIGEKFKSDIFEAVLGAVYLDGGLENARSYVRRNLLSKQYRAARNYKSELQELLAASPTYRTEEEKNACFVARVTVRGKTYEGRGRRKISAEQEAAKAAVEDISVTN